MFRLLLCGIVVLIAAASLIAGCTQPSQQGSELTADQPAEALTGQTGPPSGAKTIVATLRDHGQFSTLIRALEAAGLESELQNGGPFTVFAPTDDAFAALPEGFLDEMLSDPLADPGLYTLLAYHVAEGEYKAMDIATIGSVTTLEGKPLPIIVEGSDIKLDNATVIEANIEASNGVIHGINAVIIPPDMTVPSPGQNET